MSHCERERERERMHTVMKEEEDDEEEEKPTEKPLHRGQDWNPQSLSPELSAVATRSQHPAPQNLS